MRQWFPQPGQSVCGIYIGPQMLSGKHGPRRVFVLEMDDELLALSGAMLLQAFTRLPKGSEVSVTYTGRATGREHEYKQYMVNVLRRAPSEDDDCSDWDDTSSSIQFSQFEGQS